MRLGVSLTSLETRVSRLEEAGRYAAMRNVEILPGYEFKIYDEQGRFRHYKPNPTALAFHSSNSFVRLVLGPYGSGKSTLMMAEILLRACSMTPCDDGIRRIKVAMIRNTSGELYTSTLETWRTWFNTLGQVHQRQKPVLTWEHVFNDGHGRIELTVVFIACDREEDLKKLKSTEFTIAYLNESCELPAGLLDVIKGRVNGRYPSPAICKQKYFTGVIMDTNPPDTDHWMYKCFEVSRPESYQLFKQPSGLMEDENGEPLKDAQNRFIPNIDCDNYENLAHDYYTKMAEGAPMEFIKVYCMGKYGLVVNGKPVYPSYNDDLHSVDSIDIDKNYPIYLGFDFGSTPACMVEQFVDGQLRAIKEFVSDFSTDVMTLAESHVLPWLNQFCRGMMIYSYHDPADPNGQAIAVSPSQILERLGISSEPGHSNKIQVRIDAAKYFLNKLQNGQPAFIVSRSGCPVLRQGFYGKYKYRLVHVYGEVKPKEEPEKSHPISDIQDAHQYIAMAIAQDENVPRFDTNRFLDVDKRGIL